MQFYNDVKAISDKHPNHAIEKAHAQMFNKYLETIKELMPDDIVIKSLSPVRSSDSETATTWSELLLLLGQLISVVPDRPIHF